MIRESLVVLLLLTAVSLAQAEVYVVDPLFCWPDPETTTEWTLHGDSPCVPPQSECGLIGAWGVGCGSTPTQSSTWGAVKALFKPPAR